MNKEQLLEALLEKKIISNIEDFSHVSNKALESLLISGTNLITESLSTEQTNQTAVDAIKEEWFADKDENIKKVIIENKRVTQAMTALETECKTKITELARIFDKKK